MADMLRQPDEAEQKELQDVVDDSVDVVSLRGRDVRVEWLRNATQRKISSIMVNEKDERKVIAKCAAAIVLNGYWSLLLAWWIVWRWYYYVRQYTDEELLPILEMGKKKVPAIPYFRATMFLTELKTTMAQMTREEVQKALKRFQAEQVGDSPTD